MSYYANQKRTLQAIRAFFRAVEDLSTATPGGEQNRQVDCRDWFEISVRTGGIPLPEHKAQVSAINDPISIQVGSHAFTGLAP